MAAKRNSRHNEQKSLPWGPMFLSFVVGVFIMFLIHLNDNVTPDKSDSNKNKQVETKDKTIEPTFDFYTLLPEMETVVKSPKQPKQAIVTAPTKPTTEQNSHAEKISYMLQVGSFKKSADAEAFKAKLAFLGIQSKVQTVTIDNHDTWHRVQVGPVMGRNKADALQKQLKQNDIDSLLMRAKHS